MKLLICLLRALTSSRPILKAKTLEWKNSVARMPHNTRTGNAHYLAENEDDALDYVKALLSYLPSNNVDGSPILPATETLTRKKQPTRHLIH